MARRAGDECPRGHCRGAGLTYPSTQVRGESQGRAPSAMARVWNSSAATLPIAPGLSVTKTIWPLTRRRYSQTVVLQFG